MTTICVEWTMCQVTQISDVEQTYRETGDHLWWALLGYTGDRERRDG